MGTAFLKSLLFGAVLAGSIGPIALLILATGARRGFVAGAFAGLGAALADFLYALVAFSAAALLLPLLTGYAVAIRTTCSMLLIGLGTWMLLRRPPPETAPAPPTASLWPTFGLTLVNPMTIVVFAGFVPQLPVAGSPAAAAWLASALFLGSLAVALLTAGVGAAMGAVLPGPGWRRAIRAAAAAGIMVFGLLGLAGV